LSFSALVAKKEMKKERIGLNMNMNMNRCQSEENEYDPTVQASNTMAPKPA
jgi:hypothetical protein